MQEQKKREAYRCLVIITDSHIREQLCEFLADSHIPVYYQMHGIGTASSEWLELCGLGSIQKSITLCFIPNGRKKILLAEMNQALSLHKKGTGIAVSIPMNGMQGFLYKLLNEHTAESDGEEVEKEVKKMSEPITHAMILVTINQGYSDAVMNTARAAGATGGTILKGLRCSPGKSAVIFGITIQEEQEIVAIVVPKDKMCIRDRASTGAVVYEKNSHEARHPASVTKIMTLLLIFDALSSKQISLDDTVTVSEYCLLYTSVP